MRTRKLDDLISRTDHHLECWKQFNHFLGLARIKKFSVEDEIQFLEVKSVITQELELMLAAIDCGSLSREEVHALIVAAPSIRYLSELGEGALQQLETQWHKLFMGWHSVLGQLKVQQQQQAPSDSMFASWFRPQKA